MKTQELVDYRSPGYAGKAVKIGAGVEVAESCRFAQKHGLVSVGGDCPTVDIVGGWTQGGSNQQTNQDPYWALSGGGILLRNNTELVKIFRKVIRFGCVFLGTAVDVSQHVGIAKYTSVDLSRRKAASSAIFAT
jgi:hypothetical protein